MAFYASFFSKNLQSRATRFGNTQAALKRFKQHHNTLQASIKALQKAGSLVGQQRAINKLHAFMKGFTAQKPPLTFNPNQLLWGSPNPKATRKPAQTVILSMLTNLLLHQPSQLLASNTLMPVNQAVLAGLADTPDVQITPAIKAKAKGLNDNSVAIYQWVHYWGQVFDL